MSSDSVFDSTLAIIDDDAFSARLLSRRLVAAGATTVRHLGNQDQCQPTLQALLDATSAGASNLLIVDLKAHSGATRDFIAALAPAAQAADLPIVAMAQSDDSALRTTLYSAGASGVFVRHADRNAYFEEARRILKFWADYSRPIAVGM